MTVFVLGYFWATFRRWWLCQAAGYETGLCCTNRPRDSSRESSVVTGLHEQTDTLDLHDPELAKLQQGAQAPRFTGDLV